ncbi:MAG TPA: orotidine 5'-phosphate decarboxylase [Candidatus Paceibacterota bacterium]|nr:orotidine 5'-phosphate decarboxylase [Candidatus Pacearchaeota archaeon]HRZ51051.1 orotidine 5'-phosphate decarboxylase [Candidatus Paceibacterota bacterium]HSA36790.1 orotidine 5'-phosphate decarboxylase [Candidatus Paceibacterota bacterium]
MSLLNTRSKYLQIAFNRSLAEVQEMVSLLPPTPKIIIEAGTSLIKRYGQKAVSDLNYWWAEKIGQPAYIVADLKTMDRGSAEVKSAARAGASAATCLGLAPVETIDEFIKNCETHGIDSMVDMMNVPFPFEVLQKLKNLPDIVVLHRGADEHILNREKQIPLNQITRIKGAYGKILISIAGGETTREVVSDFFNGADIAVVWRSFYEKPKDTSTLAQDFLKLIK